MFSGGCMKKNMLMRKFITSALATTAAVAIEVATEERIEVG